jgi:hypothetical protein
VYSIEEILEATNTILNKKSSTDISSNKEEIKLVIPSKKIKLNNNEIKALNDEMNKLFKSFISSTTQSIIKNN